VSQLATYRNPANFHAPYSFIPERWFSDSDGEFGNDRKLAFQPFSYGPRNCLGKNMAYHEVRLILAKVLWNFDLTLSPESDGWTDQKTYILWEKKPLMCRLTPAGRA